MAKVDITKVPDNAPGKLVLVTGVSPTPAGEGKSTSLIGLTDGKLMANEVMVYLREQGGVRTTVDGRMHAR